MVCFERISDSFYPYSLYHVLVMMADHLTQNECAVHPRLRLMSILTPKKPHQFNCNLKQTVTCDQTHRRLQCLQQWPHTLISFGSCYSLLNSWGPFSHTSSLSSCPFLVNQKLTQVVDEGGLFFSDFSRRD